MAYQGVHLPRGYDVAVKDDSGTWVDLGVTMDGGTLEASYENTNITGSRAEKILTAFREFSVSSTFTLAQIQLENIDLLMSGATSYDTVEDTPVTGETQTFTAGNWEEQVFLQLDGQNADGTAPTVNSVTDSQEISDYEIVKSGQVWGIVVTVANDDTEDLVVDYDYTPAASKSLSMGSNSVEIAPRAFRIRKNLGTDAAPKYFGVEIYAAVNEGGLSLAFPRYDADDITTLEVTLNGELDTTRGDLDQLLKITDETAA